MNKTLLIIKREYLTRVRKKTFIISTILFPVLYLGLIFGMTYMGAKSRPKLDVAVIDSSGYFDRGKIERENQKDSSSLLSLLNIEADSLKKSFSDMGYDGYIVIPRQDDWQSGLRGLNMYTSRTMGADAS
ncbi:MAG TPA: ABC transporter permease, partial [Chitinophagaceae bacterium]|nr:ABC transporter permease [Chitinophagaceae bacterium]